MNFFPPYFATLSVTVVDMLWSSRDSRVFFTLVSPASDIEFNVLLMCPCIFSHSTLFLYCSSNESSLMFCFSGTFQPVLPFHFRIEIWACFPLVHEHLRQFSTFYLPHCWFFLFTFLINHGIWGVGNNRFCIQMVPDVRMVKEWIIASIYSKNDELFHLKKVWPDHFHQKEIEE